MVCILPYSYVLYSQPHLKCGCSIDYYANVNILFSFWKLFAWKVIIDRSNFVLLMKFIAVRYISASWCRSRFAVIPPYSTALPHHKITTSGASSRAFRSKTGIFTKFNHDFHIHRTSARSKRRFMPRFSLFPEGIVVSLHKIYEIPVNWYLFNPWIGLCLKERNGIGLCPQGLHPQILTDV